MTDKDVLANIKETLRAELGKCANEEIDKLTHKFVCEMGKVKSKLITALINSIDVKMTQDISNQQIVFQINIKGGANNDR